jgi:rod shape-determining protein MreC
MAWYGRRRSGEQRSGARAVVVGFGLAMLGVLAIQTSDIVRGGISASRRSMDAATTSMAGFAANATSWSIGFGQDAKTKAALEAKDRQILELQRWKDLADTMSLRMDRYEELLHLVGEAQAQGVTARVVAEAEGPFAATRIANAGAVDGVEEGFAAINEHGLVGRVIRVGPHSSRILLLSDYNSRIPVMGAQSQDRAMLVGDRGQGARLQNAETPGKIVDGELWYTSGDDGQLPQGVKVGRARRDKNGELRIDLSMMEGHIDFVRLVPPPAIPRPDAPDLPPPPTAKLTGKPVAKPAASPSPAVARPATPAASPSAAPTSASPTPRGPQ